MKQHTTETVGTFLKKASAAAVGADRLTASSFRRPSSAKSGTVAPSNRIRIGCIGIGNMGTYNMAAFLEKPDARNRCRVRCGRRSAGGSCDVEKEVRQEGMRGIQRFPGTARRNGPRCSVDRHARSLARACSPSPRHQRGLDVYGEKPLAFSIAEGRAIVDAVAALLLSGRPAAGSVRSGTSAMPANSCAMAASERYTPCVSASQRVQHRRKRRLPSRSPPDGFDYEMWLGPAPKAPYTPQPLPLELPLDQRLLRRTAHRLGRPSLRHRPVGHGHRD